MTTGLCDCVRLREQVRVLEDALKKYGRHGTVEVVCESSKHSDFKCNCGFEQALNQDSLGDGK